MKKKFFITIIFLLLLNNGYSGPISSLYMVSWQNAGMQVVQGNSVVNSWERAGLNELAVVVDGTVKTYAYSTEDSYGAEYTLGGTPTGTTYALDYPNNLYIDATTDGTYIYVTGNTTNKIYRFNNDWTNGQLMFTANEVGRTLGITYDPTDNTLWLSGYNNSTMSHYDLNGNLLETFNVADTRTGALALDHADGTLWYYAHDNHQLHQYSKDGTLLQRADITGLGTRLWGGEFDFELAYIPEPCSLICISVVLFWMFLKLRK